MMAKESGIFDIINEIEHAYTTGSLKEACQRYLPWTCPRCTFVNEDYPGVCEICDAPRWPENVRKEQVHEIERKTGLEYVHDIYQSLGLPEDIQNQIVSDEDDSVLILYSPSINEFRKCVKSNTPCIIKDLPQFQEVSSLWTCQYLSTKCGDRVVPIRIRSDIAKQNVYETIDCKFSSYLENRGQGYAARIILQDHLPEIAKDVPLIRDHPYQSCFGMPIQSGTILYLGPGLQRTPLHFDSAENILHQIEGTKTFHIFPPGMNKKLKPSKLNRSTVYSDLDFFDADISRELRKTALSITLNPGDALYLPVAWFHAVEGGEGPNTSVHYWFQLHDDKIDAETKLNALFRR